MTEKYQPSEYERALKAKLEGLPPQRQLFFAVWCIKPLWVLFHEVLFEQINPADRKVIQDSLKTLEQQALGGPTVSCGPAVSAAIAGLGGTEEGHESIEPEPYNGSTTLATVLENVANGAPNAAVVAASAILEVLYDHLRFAEYEGDLWTAPALLQEMNTQRVMIDRLLEMDPTPDLLNRGRDSPLFEVIW